MVQSMSELHLPLIDQLPEQLVTPERFGKVALAAVESEFLDIPETQLVFGRFPEIKSIGWGEA